MLTQDKYWELNICDEGHGSWGQQGTEVACKTWLSGGRVIVNHKTWYAHLFRTQGGDFSFPYPISGHDVGKAREYSKKLFLERTWPKAKYDIKWLLKRFWPVPDWSEEDIGVKKGPSKGILYYTDNQINMKLASTCRKRIEESGYPITSVTLKPTKFGKNIVINKQRGYETMFEQILAGLEAMTEDIVYFCEHDILYHPDHFQFTPIKDDKFYYNGNYWFVRLKDGFAIHYNVNPLSGLVAYRKPLLEHFRERMEIIKKEGFSYKMGFEPMLHHRIKWKKWFDTEVFIPDHPNVDLCHGGNSTWKRWNQKHFRKKPTFWEESTVNFIPGWENLPAIVSKFK